MLVAEVGVKDCIETIFTRVPGLNLDNKECACNNDVQDGHQIMLFETTITHFNLIDPRSNFCFFCE